MKIIVIIINTDYKAVTHHTLQQITNHAENILVAPILAIFSSKVLLTLLAR